MLSPILHPRSIKQQLLRASTMLSRYSALSLDLSCHYLSGHWASQGAQMVKNLPAMWETRIQPLGWEYPMTEMATHSSVVAWRIPGTAEPGGLPSMGLHRVGHD